MEFFQSFWTRFHERRIGDHRQQPYCSINYDKVMYTATSLSLLCFMLVVAAAFIARRACKCYHTTVSVTRLAMESHYNRRTAGGAMACCLQPSCYIFETTDRCLNSSCSRRAGASLRVLSIPGAPQSSRSEDRKFKRGSTYRQLQGLRSPDKSGN